ncbi:MAG TPA: hypothetical protein VIF10_04945 [Methylobacter sp.]
MLQKLSFQRLILFKEYIMILFNKRITICVVACACLSFSLEVSAQCTVSQPSIKAGDDVKVVATLHTSDPNENGEGEPLTVVSSGGELTATIPDYELPHSVEFKAKQDGDIIDGTIAGFEGDESCDIQVSANSKDWFTKTQKDAFTKAAFALGGVSGASWTLAESCSLGIVTAICTPYAGLTAALSTTASVLMGALAYDPPDLNYTQVAVPVPAPFTPITSGNGLIQSEADGFNAVLTNEANMVGLLRAMYITMNRSSSAEAAGDQVSVAKQVQAMTNFLLQLGQVLQNEAAVRQNLVVLLKASGFPTTTITPNDVFNLESTLAFSGWPSELQAFLVAIGDDSSTIEAARRLIYVQDINTVAGQFPDFIASPTLIATLKAASQALSGITVTVDIKPGTFPNAINVKSNGVIPVAILTTDTFDATNVDTASVKFGPSEAPAVNSHIEDVNSDGKLDLLLQFNTQHTGIKCNDTTSALIGKTINGTPIFGADSVQTVSCK